MNLPELVERVQKRRQLPAPAMRVAIRKSAGPAATQQLVADYVGVSRATIAHYERGTKDPRGEHLDRYGEALDALRAIAAS